MVVGLCRQRLVFTMSWQRLGESDGVWFDEEVLGGWTGGEDVETFPNDPFKMVEACIISSGERKVAGKGDGSLDDGEPRIAVHGPGALDALGG